MLFMHHSIILHFFFLSSAQGSDYKALEHQRLASSLEHSVSGCDGAAQSMKDAVGTQGTVHLVMTLAAWNSQTQSTTGFSGKGHSLEAFCLSRTPAG